MRKSLLILVVVLSVVLLQGEAQAAKPAGFVAATRGDVLLVRGTDAIPATIGMQVVEGDRIRTGEKARIKILLTDDAILALGSKTEVLIEKHLFGSSDTRKTELRLSQGTLRAVVQKMVGGSQADFNVKTANAVAGVRGTEFVLVREGDETKLVTLTGSVELSGPDQKKVLVAAGEGSQVERDGQAAVASALDPKVLSSVREATDTEQSPTALAWVVQVSPKDRLSSARVVDESGQAADMDASGESRGENLSPNLEQEAQNDFHNPGTAGADEFGDITALKEGWDNPALEPGGARGNLSLRIHIVHR